MRRPLVRVLALLLAGALGACSGEGSDSQTKPAAGGGSAWFAEGASEKGLVFQHVSGHAERHLMPEIMGGGAALFDHDDDGDLDAYLVQSGNLLAPGDPAGTNRLYTNDGSGGFEDITAGSGAEDPRYGMGVACADVNGDGRTDLYVTNVGRNSLLLNQGDGRFRDATEELGGGDTGWGCSAAFFDFDRDGSLDLFVTNYLDWSIETELPCMDALGRPDYCSPKNYKTPARDALFRNAAGALRDVTATSGVGAERGTGLGVGCGDFDGDGWTDVFVANDGMFDHLWHNLGADAPGTFENVAQLWGCATDANGLEKAGMGVAVADVDDDLDLDVLVCNLAGETDSMYLNQGGFFGDRTAMAGLGAVSKPFTRFGMAWHDFDHDGVLDLYQANGRVQRAGHDVEGDAYAEENLLFRGQGDARFQEVLPRGGVDAPLVATSRAAAFGDVDGDGALDVVVVNRDAGAYLLLNQAAGDAPWILLDVREASGSPALGAELRIRLGQRELRRDVRAGYSYLASNDPRVHLGLGGDDGAQGVDSVEVRWSDGTRERFGPLAKNAVHRLARGAGMASTGPTSDGH